MRPSTLLLLSLLATACAPEAAEPELHARVAGSVGEVLHPTAVYVRFLQAEGQVAVSDGIGGAELGRGPITPGARLPLTLSGRSCELESRGTVVETDVVPLTNARESPARLANPTRERNTTVLAVTLRCADGQPVPGMISPSALAATSAVLWLLPLFLLGGLLGAAWWRGDEGNVLALQLGSAALSLAAAIGAVVFSLRTLNGPITLTWPVLALGVGAAAFLATLLALRNREVKLRVAAAGIVFAALAGPLIILSRYPLWGWGAPLAALGISLVGALVALIYGLSD